MRASLPLSLYVHVPWCEKKCPYCDFNSHAQKNPIPENAYIEALMADLDQELPAVRGRRLRSIFIGGGTPSLLSPKSVESIVTGIRARIPSTPDMEITLEANPGSSDAGKFEGFRTAGVNRLSIGIQSFNAASLRNIGRIHDDHAARHAVTAAISAGFDNFNLDLMYALPGQTREMAADDVERALSFEPPHLSCYQLTIEPNTVFAVRTPRLPGENAAWQMQRQLESNLEKNGYKNYEVSAFARQGRSCQHNLNYWLFGDYIGIGAGAHSKVTRHDEVLRNWKRKNPILYMQNAHSTERVGGEKRLSSDEICFEFMLNALRLQRPVTASLFQQRTGQSIKRFSSTIAQAQTDGLLQFDGIQISTTEFGRRFLNDLLQRFLPDSDNLISPSPST
jgi:oxygen-independent coproporphyrinogen-3 oxidase